MEGSTGEWNWAKSQIIRIKMEQILEIAGQEAWDKEKTMEVIQRTLKSHTARIIRRYGASSLLHLVRWVIVITSGENEEQMMNFVGRIEAHERNQRMQN